MDGIHSSNWMREVHTVTYFCDLGHVEPLQFETAGKWREHMQDLKLHPEHIRKAPTKTQLDALLSRKQQIALRNLYFCPLCEEIPKDIWEHLDKIDAAKLRAKLINHIARDLISLAGMSLPCVDDGYVSGDADVNSVVLKSSRGRRRRNSASLPHTPSQPDSIERLSALSDSDFDDHGAISPPPVPIINPDTGQNAWETKDLREDPNITELWRDILDKKLSHGEADSTLQEFAAAYFTQTRRSPPQTSYGLTVLYESKSSIVEYGFLRLAQLQSRLLLTLVILALSLFMDWRETAKRVGQLNTHCHHGLRLCSL